MAMSSARLSNCLPIRMLGDDADMIRRSGRGSSLFNSAGWNASKQMTGDMRTTRRCGEEGVQSVRLIPGGLSVSPSFKSHVDLHWQVDVPCRDFELPPGKGVRLDNYRSAPSPQGVLLIDRKCLERVDLHGTRFCFRYEPIIPSGPMRTISLTCPFTLTITPSMSLQAPSRLSIPIKT